MAISIRDLHHRAMEHVDEAVALRRTKKDSRNVKRLFTRAFLLERLAASWARKEPSRSILYRSAAWMAIEAQRYADAEACARAGLEGSPSGEFRDELKVALETAITRQKKKASQ